MMIGIPRERQDGENRVAIIPSGVSTLLEAGYEVVVESGAGSAAHFTDDDYRHAGAIIADNADALYRQATVILKVRAPSSEEAQLIQQDAALVSCSIPGSTSRCWNSWPGKTCRHLPWTWCPEPPGPSPWTC